MKAIKGVFVTMLLLASIIFATTASAANGVISANEQAILDIAAKGIEINGKTFTATAAQITQQRNAYLAATTDISDSDLATIKANVQAAKAEIINSGVDLTGVTTLAQLLAVLPADVSAKVQSLITATASLAHVDPALVTAALATAGGSPAGVTSPVKQTGNSMLGSYGAVLIAVVLGLLGTVKLTKKLA
ncbi:MAG: hypothetical protein LBN08_05390 [Lactobacillales bacterium]|jgi:hypothetical protein|nr:hypothetical protein [Lactobacillales bacterium]